MNYLALGGVLAAVDGDKSKKAGGAHELRQSI